VTRTIVILNPRSGGGRTGRAWDGIAARLKTAIGAFDVAVTDRPMAAQTLTSRALGQGYGLVVAVGGDGTVNEVINGFFLGGVPVNREAELGLLMSGSGGDFRRTFGIGDGVDDAIARLASGSMRAIDVGRVSFLTDDGKPATRHFVNIASFGLSGDVVRRVNRARLSKLAGGEFSFFWNSLVGSLAWRNLPVRLKIDGGFDEVVPVTTVAVANGRYFGGGMRVAPDADPTDGLFDVTVMAGLTRSDFLLRSGELYSGGHARDPKVRIIRGRTVIAAPVEETRRAPVLLETDGEAPGRLPATFEILPRMIRLRC